MDKERRGLVRTLGVTDFSPIFTFEELIFLNPVHAQIWRILELPNMGNFCVHHSEEVIFRTAKGTLTGHTHRGLKPPMSRCTPAPPIVGLGWIPPRKEVASPRGTNSYWKSCHKELIDKESSQESKDWTGSSSSVHVLILMLDTI